MLDVTTTTETVRTPDGRSLDLYLAGRPDGDVLLFHSGTPGVPIPYDPMTADDEGHLTLGITRFGDVLDALVSSGR